MKIRRIEPILEVVVYKPGMEDGFLDLWHNKEAHGLAFDKPSEFANEPIQLPYILTINGDEIVNIGDWIVVNPLSPGGRRSIINKGDFKRFEILEY